MKTLRVIRCEAPNPESVLDRELKQFTAASPPELLVLVDFSLEVYWLQPNTYISLVALYHLTRRQDGVRVCLSVSTPEAVAGDMPRSVDDQWLENLHLPWFELGQPLRLRPKFGVREIGNTGIEQYGIAAVTDGLRDVPLPWLLAVASARLSHSLQRQLIPLSALDPLLTEPFEQIGAADGWIEERLAVSGDIEFRRLLLQPGAMRELRAPRDYAFAMAVGGEVQLGEITLAANEAVLLAPIWRGGRVANQGVAPCALLLAHPGMRAH